MCKNRFPRLDTLEIEGDRWGDGNRKETNLFLEVKRLFGVESVFSLRKDFRGTIIHKWNWRGFANT
jgi:hypothetical protein